MALLYHRRIFLAFKCVSSFTLAAYLCYQDLHLHPFLLSVSPKSYSQSPYPYLPSHPKTQPTMIIHHDNHPQ
ncbi:hypothetical protein P692DRAFT_20539466 [Suillus brevipes Sb2]|nr:hypothetical protein P692DRAFT_20539466 [Suillus brevipes Sb2]